MTSDPVYDDGSKGWTVTWKERLANHRWSGDIDIAKRKSVSLRSVVARVNRTVVIYSFVLGGDDEYGGLIEFSFGAQSTNPPSVDKVTLTYTQFKNLGRGGLSGAGTIGYACSCEAPSTNVFEGCSWTASRDYALHAESGQGPLILPNNVFTNVQNAVIYV